MNFIFGLFYKILWPKRPKSLFLHSKLAFWYLKIGLWCNGSTTDFDSVCLGSKPGNPTKGTEQSVPFFMPAYYHYFNLNILLIFKIFVLE